VAVPFMIATVALRNAFAVSLGNPSFEFHMPITTVPAGLRTSVTRTITREAPVCACREDGNEVPTTALDASCAKSLREIFK
jgi:hypothetical protein